MRFPAWIALLGLCTLIGCNSGGGGAQIEGGDTNAAGQLDGVSKGESKGLICVSVLDLGNPFFKVIGDNITAEAAKHGYDVQVVSGDMDVAKQTNQVKDFIVKEAAAIVLCPCNSKTIGPAIKQANVAGIPVFTTDIACLAEDAKVECHIATDNLGGGREAGKAMIEALGAEGGKIIILDYKSAESCLLRVQGFKEVIDDYNSKRETGKIEIVDELPGEGKKDLGAKVTEDAIQSHSDLVGIFAINDPSALGAWSSLEKAGKADQVKIVGFDGQPEGLQAIKDGKIYADPIQFPDRMGIETVQTILRFFDGESVEAEKLIPTMLYRQEDGLKDESLD